MKAHSGDLIVVESERADQSGRRGVIEEVINEEPPRFRSTRSDGQELASSANEANRLCLTIFDERESTATTGDKALAK